VRLVQRTIADAVVGGAGTEPLDDLSATRVDEAVLHDAAGVALSLTLYVRQAGSSNSSGRARVRVGLFADALETTDGDPVRLRATLGQATASVDHLCVGDHVSFFTGAGSDGLGDGWLGIWVSPRRYAAVRDHITRQAAEVGRDPSRFDHALNVWCGFAPAREAARELVAAQMQRFYQMPFEPFERYSPYGTPEDVAEFLRPYIDAGCSTFNVIPCARDDDSAIAAVGELRTLLTASVATVATG
jgi:hypothetical protein